MALKLEVFETPDSPKGPRTLVLDSIVLETDAPDIAPNFLERGAPNKPEYLPRIAQTLAELRDMTVDEIAAATTANALTILPALTPSHL